MMGLSSFTHHSQAPLSSGAAHARRHGRGRLAAAGKLDEGPLPLLDSGGTALHGASATPRTATSLAHTSFTLRGEARNAAASLRTIWNMGSFEVDGLVGDQPDCHQARSSSRGH